MRLTHSPIRVETLLREVASPNRGGSCVFVGTVRNDPTGGGVTAIEYSAYGAMAEAELDQIIAEACGQHPDARVAVCHRLGPVPVGSASVAVAAAAPHRAEAFAACRFVIDELKRRLPIWKKELHADGTAQWLKPEERAAPSEAAPQ